MPEGLPLPGIPIPLPGPGQPHTPLEELIERLKRLREQREREQAEQTVPEPDVPQPLESAPAEPASSRQQRRADRQAARLERRQERRAARAARGPRTLPPGLFQVLGGIFGGGGSVPTAPPSRFPTPGELRTQAARAQPMSLLGNIGNSLLSGIAQRLATPKNTATLATGIIPGLQITGPAMMRAFNSRQALAPLPGAGFQTGGRFGNGQTLRLPGMRKRRRTNPTNVRALRRALSRVEGFIKIEKRVDKILRRVAPKARQAQRVGFVKRKR